MFSDFLLPILLFAPPAAMLLWFLIALVLYLRTPKEHVQTRKTRRTLLLIPGIILLVMLVSIAALAIQLALAIKHM